jgi:hypothetical protein
MSTETIPGKRTQVWPALTGPGERVRILKGKNDKSATILQKLIIPPLTGIWYGCAVSSMKPAGCQDGVILFG